jgi:hypothetical protein
MDLKKMASQAFINSILEGFPKNEYLKLQWEVLEEMVIDLERKSAELVRLAEEARKRKP